MGGGEARALPATRPNLPVDVACVARASAIYLALLAVSRKLTGLVTAFEEKFSLWARDIVQRLQPMIRRFPMTGKFRP